MWKDEWGHESTTTTTAVAAATTATVDGDAAVSAAMDGDAAVSTSGGNGNAATDDVWSAVHALLSSTTPADDSDSAKRKRR